MGEHRHAPATATPAAPARRPTRDTRPPAGRGNAAAQAALAARGQPLSPDAKLATDQASLAVFAAQTGATGVDARLARRAGTAPRLGDTAAGRTLDGAGLGVGGVLSAVGHFMGDPRVTDDLFGHAVAASAKAGLDTLVDVANPLAPLAGLPGLVNNLTPADSAWKPVTETATAANPFEQMKQGTSGGVDAATVLGLWAQDGGDAAAFRGATVMEETAISGGYGPMPQALTGLTALATGDDQLANKLTDRDAESGKRGVFAQAGNAVGDEAWAVREAIRTAPETYERAQAGIQAGAAALLEGTSPEEQARSQAMQALLQDRFIE